MVGSRTFTAVVGVVASLVLSVVLWYVFNTAVFFLFVPFVPFLFRGVGGLRRGSSQAPADGTRTCPTCGFRTRDPTYDYCPRDGSRLD